MTEPENPWQKAAAELNLLIHDGDPKWLEQSGRDLMLLLVESGLLKRIIDVSRDMEISRGGVSFRHQGLGNVAYEVSQ